MIRFKLINKNSEEVLKKTNDILTSGGLVIFPSDTVYGLLCDATNKPAVQKLLEFKERPAGKPISVFVADFGMMKSIVKVDARTEVRLRELLPGPYTIILRSKHKVRKTLESEKGTLGVRLPKNSLIKHLIKEFGKPVTATSANLSSRPPHYSVESFLKQTSKKRLELIDLIVDVGELPHNKPSTVVDFTTEELKILREGDLNVLPSSIYVSRSEEETKQIACNILKKVYSSSEQSESRSSRQARTIKPIVFILKGDLGTGKTIFVKGIGECLGIKNIISPTFVVYYEYPVKKNQFVRMLIHADLYNVQDADEFEHLGLEKYLEPGNLMCIEWGEKAAEIVDSIKEHSKLIWVNLEHVSQLERKITISI